MIQLPEVHEEARRLAMLQSLGLSQGSDDSLNALATLAATLAGTEIGLVNLVESQSICVPGAHGFKGKQIDRWDSFCSHALLQPSTCLWVDDALQDHRFCKSRYVVGEPHIRFYAGIPLLVNGCTVGTLCVVGPDPRPFDAQLVERLQRVADVCAAELAERHRTNALRLALHASADALVDCDAEGRIQTWSAGAEQLFGFQRDEAMGAGIAIIIPPDHREAHDQGMRRWRNSGAARLGRRLELPALRKDGSTLDIELWMSVSHDHGEARIHANIRDISERRTQARALACATARAEAANLAKTAFLANMSHELRTPLNGVTACSAMLDATALEPEQHRLVDIIASAAGDLNRLIEDLLDMARIEAGELRLEPAPVDLGELVNGLISLCRLKADEKGIALRLEMQPGAGDAALVDQARMKQILVNLLSNAIKFTDRGEVVLSVTRWSDDVRFEVRDTGIGFGPEHRDAIFDRFQQADPTITRRFGGTGLGLAICRDLVRAMGGKIDCTSVPGQGSEFWVELHLPLATRPTRQVTVVAEAPAPAAALRVLVVDDNATNRQVAGLILETAGMATSFAGTGREALEVLSTYPADFILMDMMMPEMDGVEATRRLRAGEAGPHAQGLPVVMLTANTLPEHVAQSLAAGADAHLAKPITPASLLQCMAEVQTACAAKPAESADGVMRAEARSA